jgi:hypothetical protein
MIIVSILLAGTAAAQTVSSGNYGSLTLAYDSTTRLLTGHYANATGDDGHGGPMFTCDFYLKGRVAGNRFAINSWYPGSEADSIGGIVEIVDPEFIKIRLRENPGGCDNVQQFSGDPAEFTLQEKNEEALIQVRYVQAMKTFFYRDKTEAAKLKSYLVAGDVVDVKQVDGAWVLCTYSGKKITTGWLRVEDLNKL